MATDYISDQLRAKAAELRAAASQRIVLWQSGMTDQQRAEHKAKMEADYAALKVLGEQRQAADVAEWKTLRAAVPDGQAGMALLAVLDIHKPFLPGYDFGSGPRCEHCQEGGYDSDSVVWPCETYSAVREAMAGVSNLTR